MIFYASLELMDFFLAFPPIFMLVMAFLEVKDKNQIQYPTGTPCTKLPARRSEALSNLFSVILLQ